LYEDSDSGFILVFLGVSTLTGETSKHIRIFEHKSCSKPRHIPEKWRRKIPIKVHICTILYTILLYCFIYSFRGPR